MKGCGVASACHILVADERGGTGLECTYRDVVELGMGAEGAVVHTNHLVRLHEGVEDPLRWVDSRPRLERVGELLRDVGREGVGGVERGEGGEVERGEGGGVGRAEGGVERGIELILQDEQGWPTSICRQRTETSTVETLFSVVMDLGRKRGRARMGRPTEAGEEIWLEP